MLTDINIFKYSNLNTIHCVVLSQVNGKIQSFTFPKNLNGRRPFLYYHGCQIPNGGTLICGVVNEGGITTYDKIYGMAGIEIDEFTIKTTLISSWAYGYVIYFS